MKKFLVVGNPIEHSLSPKLQNYWIKNNDLNAIYGKLETLETDLPELCNNLKKGELDGLNVTIPFKKTIIPFLDILSGNSLRTQSVNTISVENGNLIGHNTDIDGFELSIRKLNFDITNKKILVLGAGGVVPSIIYALMKMKTSKIYITNRTKEKAENLKNLFKDLEVIDWGILPDFDVIINATSLGLNKSDKFEIDFNKAGQNKLFYDVIYDPFNTEFSETGSKPHNMLENGLNMFLFQAQKAFQIWHNINPEINDDVISFIKNKKNEIK
tara:strand:+ start:327 stop:1139 length:813 start_codon:yes stop_codon:yes gene_type:complete